MRVVGRGGRQVHKLHEETSRYVQASAQSFMMRAIQEHVQKKNMRYIEGEGITRRHFRSQKISRSPIIEERQGLRR